MLQRVPVRIRLALGFSFGLLVVLVLAGAFVYVRVGDDLNQALEASLVARADDLSTLIQGSPGAVDLGGVRTGEGEPTFTEMLGADGHVVDSTLPPGRPLLTDAQRKRALAGTIRVTRRGVNGIEGESRALARPVRTGGRTLIAIVGVSAGDRAEALSGIARAFSVGGPLALLHVRRAR